MFLQYEMYYVISPAVIFLLSYIYVYSNEAIVNHCVLITRLVKPSEITMALSWDYLYDRVSEHLVSDTNHDLHIAAQEMKNSNCKHLILIGRQRAVDHYRLEHKQKFWCPSLSVFSFTWIMYFSKCSPNHDVFL